MKNLGAHQNPDVGCPWRMRVSARKREGLLRQIEPILPNAIHEYPMEMGFFASLLSG
jgi:hypothetical protein